MFPECYRWWCFSWYFPGFRCIFGIFLCEFSRLAKVTEIGSLAHPAGYTPLGCSFHGKSCEQWMITRGIWLWKPPCWKIWTFHWFQTKQTLALIWTCYWQKVAGLKPIANRIWFFAARIWALEGLASGKSPDVPSFRMILLLHCHHGFPSSMARYSCIHFFDYIWISYSFTKLKIAERRLKFTFGDDSPLLPIIPVTSHWGNYNSSSIAFWVSISGSGTPSFVGPETGTEPEPRNPGGTLEPAGVATLG